MGFYVVASTREDLSIDVSITNIGLILIMIYLFGKSVYNRGMH